MARQSGKLVWGTALVATVVLVLYVANRHDVSPSDAAGSNDTTRVAEESEAADDTSLPALTAGNTQFALDFLQYMHGEAEKSAFAFSPFSVSSAFAVALAGATQGSKTQAELAAALHLGGVKGLHSAFRSLTSLLHESEAPADKRSQVQVANHLFVAPDFELFDSFKQTASLYGGSELVDFCDAGAAVAVINAWVSEQTHKKIPTLLEKHDVSCTTVATILNAVYFNGKWKSPFNKDLTEENTDFISYKGDVTKVDLMELSGLTVPYFENDVLQSVALPYTDELSMVVVLPAKPGKGVLDEVVSSLTSADTWHTSLLEKMAPTKIKLHLPRMELDTTVDLKPVFQQLGVHEAFEESAEFGAISPTPGIRISTGIHKAKVSVDESGTEAAAATAVVMMVKAAVMSTKPIPVFRADRSFLFFIVHNPTNTILFAGRY
eukprot:gnl/Hemi2/14454_TR4901_c0_g1_i1.p1 gnl/Hemi2/14454_TR4901_c0_g1~~gnl/Hemi2/14454_TR4901_c0_g1_i1.p1  ORF type:complete len:435 (+),score=111.15 gnl/Hemi2/14454_TR4901_c0_g1_i1:47-1351(+)